MLGMSKRQITSTEAFDLRQALHIATLDALMASRRWEPGDLVFQGGTSLHLAHGSPRYSEDLDFLVKSALNLKNIAQSMETRLAGTHWLPEDTTLTVSAAKDGHNPHAFDVTIGGPNVIGSVRVKVELWQTSPEAIAGVRAVVCPVRLSRGLAAGMQTFVPTADLKDIYADKVFAVAARPYLKPRDVFDLHWLKTRSNLSSCSAEDMRVRLLTYPNETAAGWLDKAFARRNSLRDAGPAILKDLKRWLPASWPLSEASVADMIESTIASIEQGIDMMRVVRDELDMSRGLTP